MGDGLKRSRPAKHLESTLAAQGIGHFAYHFGFLSSVLAAQAVELSLWGQAPGAMVQTPHASVAPLGEGSVARPGSEQHERSGATPRRLPPGRQEASLASRGENVGLDHGRAPGKGFGLRKGRAS